MLSVDVHDGPVRHSVGHLQKKNGSFYTIKTRNVYIAGVSLLDPVFLHRESRSLGPAASGDILLQFTAHALTHNVFFVFENKSHQAVFCWSVAIDKLAT